METGTAMVFLALLLTGGLCIVFLAVAQPIWGIIDVAVSKQHSGGTKAFVVVLTLVLLGPVMTILYACFGRCSSALRKSTLIALAALFGVGASGIALAVAVPAVTGRWRPFPSNVSTAQNSRRDKPALGAFKQLAAGEVAPFTALNIVATDTGWRVSLAEFTGFGPKADSAIPVILPSIYPVTHLAIDSDRSVCYAITTHDVGRITATGHFLEIKPDPAIGKPSWPSAIAWDSTGNQLLIAARSRGYSYHPDSGKWSVLPGLVDDNLIALEYYAEERVLYGLRSRPGGELAVSLVKLSPAGAFLKETQLSHAIPVGRYPFPLAQLRWAEAQFIVLVAAPDRASAPTQSPAQPAMYAVDPHTGVCRLVEEVSQAQGEVAGHE